MKLRVSCHECHRIAYEKDKHKRVPYVPSYPYWEYPTIELEKWPYIEMVCKHGHKQRFTLNLELYELLFQQATYCITDGYYREAISTYSSALERYFEYAIEMLSLNFNINIDFKTLWNKVKKQSERQVGAFYFLWSAHFKELPDFLNDDMTKLRNAVVHQGELASYDKALEFGEYVFNYIKKSNVKLTESLGENIDRLRALRIFRICAKDFAAAEKDPIMVNVNGEKLYSGIGCISTLCFLNDESINSYSKCFEKIRLTADNMHLQK